MIRVTTPGRVCLLGEHQDYFGLKVLTAAFDRCLTIEAQPQSDRRITLRLPDLGQEVVNLTLDTDEAYVRPRDYLRAAKNILLRRGHTWSRGWEVTIRSEIPIGKGVSSSSAMCVGWVDALARMSDQEAALDRVTIAELAYQTEVAEFREPGGKMDHYATSLAGIIHVDCGPEQPNVEAFDVALPGLILGDSGVVKDTTGVLGSIRGDVEAAREELLARLPGFDLTTSLVEEVLPHLPQPLEQRHLRLIGTLEGRNLTATGLEALQGGSRHLPSLIGELMNRHHESIRDRLGVSTPKIDAMRDAALAAGAAGAKIVGSGAGGCLVILAPGAEEAVIEGLRSAGGDGTRIGVYRRTEGRE